MRKPRVIVVVQARMGSTRLPGKVLLDVHGRTVIDRVLERAALIPGADAVVVAIPRGRADRPLARALAGRPGVAVYAGSEDDVLDRFYRAAKAAKAGIVVRVTADCPLLDPAVSGRVVRALLDGVADYASNVAPATFPDGLDTEAFRFGALETAWRRAKRRTEREHVTPYLREHPELFRTTSVTNPEDLSRLRWTLDEPRDLEFMRALFAALDAVPGTPGLEEVMRTLEARPEIAARNAGILPNEGYYRSLLKEPPMKARKLKLAKSLSLYEEARKFVPGGSQTFSKAPSQFVRGVSPLFLRRGKGAHVWDVDGNEYVDLMMSLGPVSLGHCDPDVDAAVAAQLKEGTILSQPHPLEIEVSKTLAELIPCAEMARFGKNGSDATAAAVRLARYTTGRDLVAVGGYHGWQDWYIGTTTRDGGVPKAVKALTKAFPYNDPAALDKLLSADPGAYAAVVLEPIGVEEPRAGYLQEVAKIARRHGALLIFDEVVTGFRLGLGGAQAHFGVTPDLAAFGKAMANGFPLAAVVGPARLMKRFDEIFFSGTFGGELLSLAACKATISKMRRKPVIAHMWHQGRRIQDGVNTMTRELGIERYVSCVGLAPHTVVTFKDAAGEPWWALKSLVQQECVRRGYLFAGVQNPCWALSDADVEKVLRVYASALLRAAKSIRAETVAQDLEGPAVQAVFRKP